jgi:glycosyltransferase A (GT-A) superfamily protein (DUF2064 family)
MFPTVPPPPMRLLVFAQLPNGEGRAEVMDAIGTSTAELEIEVMWSPTPDANGESLRRAFGPHSIAVQTGNGHGDRLSMALSERFFFHRTEKIVVIGIDDPSLTRAMIDHAFALLESCEYVLGPAAGGDYYLIGCRALAYDPSVFLDIEWNTSTVLATTLQRIAALGRTVALLPGHERFAS